MTHAASGARHRAAAATGLLAVLLPTTLLAPGSTPPAAAAGEDACSRDILPDTERTRDVGDGVVNVPFERMNVEAAHRITRGAGSTVVVVDSGVGALPGTQVEQVATGFGGPLASGHGTIVAGLVAGPDGVAPEARLISARVLDKDSPDLQEGQRGLSSTNLAAVLEQLAQRAASERIDVVNISLALPGNDTRVEAAVQRLLDRDVVVVAAAGNAPPEGREPTSDAEVYPADYPGVVAVGAVGPSPRVDVSASVVPNKETVVAAPGGGGLSYNLNGQRCQVPTDEVATSWAAASVSGVVALLRSRFPDETRQQVVARLTRTAEGSEQAPNPWTGAGVVQAADALTHELSPRRDGELRRTEAVPRSDAQAPPPPDRTDRYAPSRTMLLWFGLVSGALVALAFVARPLLRRRG